MQFRELARAGELVNFTCFVWKSGKFRQWYPVRRKTTETHNLDQTGAQLIAANVPILHLRVHSFVPTAYNYVNVYLW